MRHSGNSYYSVYKVTEGGIFYVFWSQSENYDSGIQGEKYVSVADTFYINDLKQESDFSELQIGKSSYTDVYEIDSASELILILSNGVYSYTLLNDGNFLEIEYTNSNMESRDDLIVNAINIVPSTRITYTCLQDILPKDLP